MQYELSFFNDIKVYKIEEQFEMIFQTPHINNSTENILL